MEAIRDDARSHKQEIIDKAAGAKPAAARKRPPAGVSGSRLAPTAADGREFPAGTVVRLSAAAE